MRPRIRATYAFAFPSVPSCHPERSASSSRSQSRIVRMSPEPVIIARRLLKQAEWCRKLGSMLYSKLLQDAAADVHSQGACWAVLQGHHDDAPGSALALRFLGSVHRLVLEGNAPELATCYPSVGGRSEHADLLPRFLKTVHQHAARLRALINNPVQTNEVGRCAALLGGFLEIARRTGMPLRLLEIGASAGLILRWDHYFYETGDATWGNQQSNVRITVTFADAHPDFGVRAEIAERRGCDTSPIDPMTKEGELTLKSYVWADQVERFHRLQAAIDIARRVPAQVEKANAAGWLEATLAQSEQGAATVVYHSIVWQYLSPRDRARIEQTMEAAGRAATPANPLAWLRFEPGSDSAEVRLRLWPGSQPGEDRLLARAGFHGRPVEWLA